MILLIMRVSRRVPRYRHGRSGTSGDGRSGC